MWPIVRRFGLLALGVVALWLVTVLTLNLTVYSAGGFVMGYLRAMEEGNYTLAASRAGLGEAPLVFPSAEERISDPLILQTGSLPEGNIVVQASYSLEGETHQSLFVLSESEPTLWFFTNWRFAPAPQATLDVSVVGDNRVVINESELSLTRLGIPPRVRVLVPGVYDASLSTDWVTAETTSQTVTEVGSSNPLRISLEPTDRLQDAANDAVEDFLDECARQGVLQPAGCPFGVSIDDRIIGAPAWSILDYPDVRLTLAGDRASWSLFARNGVAEVTTQVQSLFDGSIEEVIEVVPFEVFGVVRGTLLDDPVLNLY